MKMQLFYILYQLQSFSFAKRMVNWKLTKQALNSFTAHTTGFLKITIFSVHPLYTNVYNMASLFCENTFCESFSKGWVVEISFYIRIPHGLRRKADARSACGRTLDQTLGINSYQKLPKKSVNEWLNVNISAAKFRCHRGPWRLYNHSQGMNLI